MVTWTIGEASPSPVYGAALLMRLGFIAPPGFESRSLRVWSGMYTGWAQAPVAQRIEHLTTDQKVRGSNPFGRAAAQSPNPILGGGLLDLSDPRGSLIEEEPEPAAELAPLVPEENPLVG